MPNVRAINGIRCIDMTWTIHGCMYVNVLFQRKLYVKYEI